jgi:hypothetical protein
MGAQAGESMANEQDVRGLRVARSELARRGVDIARADLRVLRGTLYIKGQVSAMRGSSIKDIKTELEHIGRLLRQRPDIRDVVIDCSFGG